MLHLQTMFERPQEVIRVRQLRMLAFAKQASFGKTAERDQCVRRAQPRIVATKSKLQRLGDELDLADSAATQLYVVSFFITLALPIDLVFCGAHICERLGDANIGSINAIFRQLREL